MAISESVAVGVSISITQNGTPVANSPFTTNSQGVLNTSLPPGDYVVTITAPDGYTLGSMSLKEGAAGSPSAVTSLTITGVTIISNDTTTITGSFTNQ